MPRTVDEILAHADALAARFEQYEPNDSDELGELDVVALSALRAAVQERSVAERHILAAVRQARVAGVLWAATGANGGYTRGEAARQSFARKIANRPAPPSSGTGVHPMMGFASV